MPPSLVHSILFKKENAHDDPIYGCAWVKVNPSEDSKDTGKEFIVTGGLDGLVKVWNLTNNRLDLFHTLEGHAMAVVSVAVSPDGCTIASSSLDSTLILWDLLTGKKRLEVETDATDVWQVGFSQDGAEVLTGGHTGKISVYSAANGQLDGIFDTRGKFVSSVVWSPNGKRVAAGSIDGAVCIFDTYNCKLLHNIDAHSQAVRSVAISKNSQYLATASNDGNLKLFNLETARHLDTVDHKCWVVSVQFSPDGTRVASAAADGTVRLLHLHNFNVLHTFQGHHDVVWGIHFNKVGDKLVSVSKDKCINIYECPIPPPPQPKK